MRRRSLRQTGDLIWELARTDFKLRYRGSILGYSWSVLKPFLTFTILYFVFSRVFGPSVPKYALSLLIGVVLWNYLAEGTILGMQSLLAKGHILAKVAVSPWAIVVSTILHATFTFALNLAVIAAFFFWQRAPVPAGSGIVLFLAACVLMSALVFALSLFLAPLFVRYRDLRQLWDVLLTLSFYATPIIYPSSAVPERMRELLAFNPMTHIIQSARAGLLTPDGPSFASLLPAVGVIGLLLAASAVFFRSASENTAEYL